MSADALTLASVLGRNCKRIRLAAGLTQDQLAQHARRLGLRWNAASVGDFEGGRSSPTMATVLAVVLVLTQATQRDVTLGELLDGDEYVALTGGIDVKSSFLAEICSGGPGRLPNSVWHAKTRSATAREIQALVEGKADGVLTRSGLAETRLAQRIGVSPTRLAAISHKLWEGRTFSEERDRRAGPNASAQKRGQVSRMLQADLEKALNNGDD